MNILFLATHLNIGGISSYLLTLCKGLKKRGHHIYLASSGGELLEEFLAEEVHYIPIPIKTKAEINPKIGFSFLKLAPLVKREKIDLIHAHTRVTQVLARMLEIYTQRPFISTCHGFFKKRCLRRIFPCWGKRIIAISPRVKEHLVKDFGIPEDKVRLVYNGIDIERFKRYAPSDMRQAKINFALGDGPVVGIIARLSDVKGHIYLLRGAKTVLESIPLAKFLIVGSGRMEKELKILTRQLQIEKSVKFIPSVKDTCSALSAMDLFVMPSINEGLGLGIMEAMAAGVCVVASSVGGIKDLIQPHKTGILVEPRDVSALSEAIISLLNDCQERKRLGQNAQEYIRENFSQGKMAQETEEVYAQCLKEKD